MQEGHAIQHLRQRWTEDQRLRLRDLWESGAEADAIAREVGHSRSGVIGEASRMGLRRKNGYWTPEREAELARLWERGWTTVEIAERMGVKKGSVCGKARRLGLAIRGGGVKAGSENPNWKGGKSLKERPKRIKKVALRPHRPKPGRLCFRLGLTNNPVD
jgi:hypothetical protein